MSIVAGIKQIQHFWIFFFSKKFWLVVIECTEAEPGDTERWLTIHPRLAHFFTFMTPSIFLPTTSYANFQLSLCLKLYGSLTILSNMLFMHKYCVLLEKEMEAHSSILAWKIPWTAEPGRLPFMESQRVGHDWVTSLHFSLPRMVEKG